MKSFGDCGDFTVAFATTETLVSADFVGIVSALKDLAKMDKTGWTAGLLPSGVMGPVSIKTYSKQYETGNTEG